MVDELSPEQLQKQEWERQARVILNEEINQAKFTGNIRSSRMRIVEDAFRRAGYSQGYGEQSYIQGLRATPEWQKIRAISQRQVELGKFTSEEARDSEKRAREKFELSKSAQDIMEVRESEKRAREKFELSTSAQDIIKGKVFKNLPAVKDSGLILSPEQQQAILKAKTSKDVERAIFEMPSLRYPTQQELKETLTVELGTPRLKDIFKKPKETKRFIQSNINVIKKFSKESQPELRYIPNSKLKRGIQFVIGAGIGTTRFSREKTVGGLTNLKDVKGKYIFTPKQARNIIDLSYEIAESYALGRGAGKVFALGRGAFAKIAPKILKSSKFNNLRKAVDYSILAGLTTAEVISLNRTLKTQGERAAYLQLVGLTSFGFGFAKTGLKSGIQAQKEFEQLGRSLKKTIPKGKRGQSQISIQLSKNRFDSLRKKLNKLQKKIAAKKSFKSQLRELAKVKSQLKGEDAIKGFNQWIKEELIDTSILKLPKVEIVPGVYARQLPTRKGIFISGIRLNKKQKRISKQIKKLNEKEILINKKIQKLNKKSKLTSKQKGKLRQLVLYKQNLNSKQLTKQKQLQKQLTKQKVKDLQKLRLSSLSKSAQKQLTKQQIKKIQKMRFPIPFPKKIKRIKRIPGGFIIPTPFWKSKKAKLKIKKAKGYGYNVYARPLKKFKKQRTPKLIKINRVPLTKTQARKLGAGIVDTSLSRTFKLKRTKGKAIRQTIPLKYISKKFRRYKVRRGRKNYYPNTYIEKNKYLLDTSQEKRKISLERRLKQLNLMNRNFRVQRRKIKTFYKPSQIKRKIIKRTPSSLQLKNLARGRAILSRMRRRK